VRTARRIVAVSEFGRDEICEVFAVPRDRVEVIYHGVEQSFAPGPAAPLPNGVFEQRYVLFVGDPIAEPRKNFAMLYEAYCRAWPRRRGIAAASVPALVVAGAQAPQWQGVVHAGNLGDDLAAGNTDEGLRALYRGAAALALVSYHETFGMPMIEAMACGTPVIASQVSSLPEIGGNAALYAPPDDIEAWASALQRVIDDPSLRDRLRVAGLDRATHFNWDESADRHLALFRAVATNGA